LLTDIRMSRASMIPVLQMGAHSRICMSSGALVPLMVSSVQRNNSLNDTTVHTPNVAVRKRRESLATLAA